MRHVPHLVRLLTTSAATLLLVTAMAACSGQEAPAEPEKTEPPAKAKVEPKPEPAKAKAQEAKPALPTALPEGHNPAMLKPKKADKKAPDTYKVKFTTTNGDFVVEAHREWSPLGADRFYNLVDIGYYDGIAFFRAIDGFMVQFGISGYPEVNAKWRDAKITDDPGGAQSNRRGYISFATSGKNTRTTQIFINYSDRNVRLDGMGFTPFAQVVQGMDVVDSLYKGYGEGAPRGRGPDQGKLQELGNAYLNESFPKLDHVIRAQFVE